MIEITKENMANANFVDKEFIKPKKEAFIKRIFNESKFLMYIFLAFIIFAIANATLIYSFFKLLSKL